MTATPALSICIPTYKGQATLGAAIDSVLAQDFGDFELIVIDDGSPDAGDATFAALRGHADPRLRWLRNPRNLGPQGNWNRCLAEARGRWFKLLPHDDVLLPGCLRRQTAVLAADTEERIAIVFCARQVLRADGTPMMRRGYPGAAEGPMPAQDVMRACVRRGTNLLGEPGGVMFRRTLAERVGAFDAANPYVIDLDYWFRLLAHGDAYYLPEPLAGFRVSASQWSVAIGSGQSSDFIAFVERASQWMRPPPTAWDKACARSASTMNGLLRSLFYRLHLR